MDYKVFYRKYRPKNFNELVGQDNIKNILINSIKLNRIAHAYIFTGPRGTGKTSTAKIFAKTLNCLNNTNGISCDECDICKNSVESADIIEIDAASNNGVDEIRTLRDSVKVAPYASKYKIYIIDEVHMLSNSAWNALLKTLEEPPKHVIFILATTEINKIPETVMSRCQRFDFSKIKSKTMFDHLSCICEIENIEIDEDALQEIVKLSSGCLRDALSYLDQISKYNCKVDVNLIENNFGVLSKTKLKDLYNFILDNKKDNIMNILDSIMESGITPINFINEFIDYLLFFIVDNQYKDKEELNFIKIIIYKLNSLLLDFNMNINLFTLIKVELITLDYFPGNKKNIISQEIIEKKVEIIPNTIKEETIEKKEVIIKKTLDGSIKDIRINNAFVNPSKELKKVFLDLWISFESKLRNENNFKLLGFIENSNIEVVSEYSVIFSFKSLSDAIIFNQNIEDIENAFTKNNSKKIKFIALSNEEWLNEKNKFIENKKKKYEFIDEIINNKEEIIKTKSIAEDIFGDELIEIR